MAAKRPLAQMMHQLAMAIYHSDRFAPLSEKGFVKLVIQHMEVFEKAVREHERGQVASPPDKPMGK